MIADAKVINCSTSFLIHENVMICISFYVIYWVTIHDKNKALSHFYSILENVLNAFRKKVSL